MPVIAITTVWWTVGFNTLVLLAGLQGVDENLYDASKVDGANNWQVFRHITIPSLRRPMTNVMGLQVIASFQIFGQVDLITRGGPAGATRTIVYYIYERAFEFWHLGYGSAMAFILFIILFVLSMIQLRLQERCMTGQLTTPAPSSRIKKPFLKRHGNKIYMTVLSLFTFFWLLPIIWTLSTSLRPETSIQANLAVLIPSPFTTEHWAHVLGSSKVPR